jgi:hypothetical protein
MRITQESLDEQSLLNNLQSGEWDKAIEVVDWYYSPSNDHGFDDPNGITKAVNIKPTNNINIPYTEPIKIRQNSKSNKSLLYIIGIRPSNPYFSIGLIMLSLQHDRNRQENNSMFD